MTLLDDDDIKTTSGQKESEVQEVKLPQKKNLIPRETIINKAHTQVDGETINIKIRYGNIITPKIKGKYQNLPDAKYKDMLEDFLCSDEGVLFYHPTEQQIDKISEETKEYIKKENAKVDDAEGGITVTSKPKPKEDKLVEKPQTPSRPQQGEQPQVKEEPQPSPKTEPPQPKKEEPKPEVKPDDIMATNNEVYLEAIREETLKSQEKELLEKAEQLKKEREQNEKILALERELEKERKKSTNKIEKLTQQVLTSNEDKNISIDRMLLKATSICLIISSCLIGILIFLGLINR